jgi:hypothetical protein
MAARFADIESINQHEVIDDYLQSPLVSLEEAMKPISHLVPGVENYAKDAKLASSTPADNLTPDESAAIYLYTMASIFYKKLNSAMRSTHMNQVKPYFLYLKLFYTALGKLPCKKATVWRGICGSVSSAYVKGKHVIWHSPSSSSIDASVVKTFLGNSSQFTLFQITCRHGKSISKHSAFPSENEILLLPGTKLLVEHQPFDHFGFQIIQLEEMYNPNVRKILPILPNIKKLTLAKKKLLEPAKLELAPGALSPIPVLPAIKQTKLEEVKLDNCE